MPYVIKPYKNGYRLYKRDDPTKAFSKKPMTLEKVKKQLKAIGYFSHRK
jgi:hypothetical protein